MSAFIARAFHTPISFDQHPQPTNYSSSIHQMNIALHSKLPYYGARHDYASIGGVPPRYAFPTMAVASRESSSQRAGGLSFSEHALRRKTPNGTIAAGYDASPVDEAVPLPAAKHVLVSSLSERSDVPAPRSTVPSQRPLEGSKQQHYFPPSRPQPQAAAPQMNPFPQIPGYTIPPSVPTYEQWEFPAGLDSVLSQTLPMQPSGRYYLHPGSSIPTVLPSSLQAYPGPTASAGNEFYGRYLPGEGFAPFTYQPAPIRDDRYLTNPYTDNLSARNHAPSSPMHYRNHPCSPLQCNRVGSQLYLASSSRNIGSFEPVPGNSFPPGYGITQSGNLLPVRQEQQEQFRRPQAPQQSNSTGAAWPLRGYSANLQNSASDTTTRSVDLHSQEKSFKWAHDVYVSLLTSIHKYRSLSAAIADGGSQRSLKPNIFPKPPRQPGSNFSFVTRSDQRSTPRPSSSKQPNTPVVLLAESQKHRSYPSTIYSPSQRQPDQWLQWGQARPDTSRLHTFSEHSHDRHGHPPSGANVNDYMNSSGPNGALSSEQLAAVTAFDMLVELCEQSGRPWIEGMLLTGCLAYGLGDYHKASDWYHAILARDACHVEAISNLAATFLMLDRRDEALRFWRQAVELRPSYFDAVEHLIGLLCGNHQTDEAVRVLTFVEQSLRLDRHGEDFLGPDATSEGENEATSRSRSSSECNPDVRDSPSFEFERGNTFSTFDLSSRGRDSVGFGSSGFAIPGSENGRILTLIHAKGNMLYSLNDNRSAAAAFEDAILIGCGRRRYGIRGLIREILMAFVKDSGEGVRKTRWQLPQDPLLLYPEKALQTAKLIFGPHGRLPGLEYVAPGPQGQSHKAAVSTMSNSLLSLAKIYQDGLSNSGTAGGPKTSTGVRDILALYYLSLSLQRSPSTANNVGILLASVQQGVSQQLAPSASTSQAINIPGVIPGSSVALALSYYNYGLNLDSQHAHLYTNLGSLLKDIGQLRAAVKMYELAVKYDQTFDIALANLANAVKDQGMVADAIKYYKRAVQANPEFAEAVCGLATALNSVCSWTGRGGIYADSGNRDRWHVDDRGILIDPKFSYRGSGWMNRVIQIVDKQLKEGASWGHHVLKPGLIEQLCQQLINLEHSAGNRNVRAKQASVTKTLRFWSGQSWQGARIVRLFECVIRRIGWQWYRDRYVHRRIYPDHRYSRPMLPTALSIPSAPTVLPFHTFTAPLSAKQIRQICQRNGLRISVMGLRSSWLPSIVLPPPAPPSPQLNVGYVSSDFNNHPLAHLMQSVFGLHSRKRVHAICYATTPPDGSVHRQQIEREAPAFHDASSWSIERLVKKIVEDGIHVLVNLNGYTRGARNEVFAARPAPIQMSFMGFAGTLGADWCDYLLADEITIPATTVSPWRKNIDPEYQLRPEALAEDEEDWMYSENIIFARKTFFCCDHRQSAPDAKSGPPPTDPHGRELAWTDEQARRWKMRKELFPSLSDDAVIFGNFNQLYKIDPCTFRLYLRILASVPTAILWLLRFPDLGEQHLISFARAWTPASVASRVVFTDVAPKDMHIVRASVVDLFLDTPECNAHTTAADVVWSGTPVLTWGKWAYKMCSRMASSIVASALPQNAEGDRARKILLVCSEQEYEDRAVELALELKYRKGEGDDKNEGGDNQGGSDEGEASSPSPSSSPSPTSSASSSPCSTSRPRLHSGSQANGQAEGRLMDMRRLLWEGRWESPLFDTQRWVNDVETAYELAWANWEKGEEGNIWL